MNAANDDNDSSGNIDQNLAWWVPVRNSSILALALAPPLCCLCYFLFPFLPQPSCIGGYTHEYASDVRAIAMLFGMGFFLALPVIAFLGCLGGIIVHFILNSPGKRRVVERVSIGLGITISLVFWLGMTLLLNRYICDL